MYKKKWTSVHSRVAALLWLSLKLKTTAPIILLHIVSLFPPGEIYGTALLLSSIPRSALQCLNRYHTTASSIIIRVSCASEARVVFAVIRSWVTGADDSMTSMCTAMKASGRSNLRCQKLQELGCPLADVGGVLHDGRNQHLSIRSSAFVLFVAWVFGLYFKKHGFSYPCMSTWV
jgi:hypothetical protein